ncbi:MAG: anthrone oxygenase family protein [Alphaproteobacteria bacterium]
MPNGLIDAVVVSTTLGAGLAAGIFFAFSTFVMTALARLHPEQGIDAMQSINETVLNPWFFTVFLGTALGSMALGLLGVIYWGAPGSAYLIFGCLLYLIGSIVVTMAFNVPLNNALAAVDPGSTHGAEIWTRYLSTWTAWNHLRTVASLGAAASFILAIR